MKIDENKLIFMNKTEITSLSAEEAHSLKLNSWKNWYCSAGIKSIYIHHDGLVYRGTCSEGGVLGSIYNEGFVDVQSGVTSWIICTKDVCACGSDMQAPKVKNSEDTRIISDKGEHSIPDYNNYKYVDKLDNPEIAFSGSIKNYKLVIWEIGRRCNYNCSYCFPSSHNNYEAHKSYGSFMHGLANITRWWATNDKIKFVFTGGEPTFNPDFLEFVSHLRNDLCHICHTTTNGSQTSLYYERLMEVSDVSFSAHLKYLETPNIYKKFIDNIRACNEVRQISEQAKLNDLSVRIMLETGKLELAKKLFADCKEIIPNVAVDLLHQGENKQIMKYSEEELDWLHQTDS